MSQVHFIVGAPGTGKSYQILNEITEKCTTDPTGAPIFILTPEQMTFHTEYQLLLMGNGNSMIRTNALSFNRLAYRVMQEVGGLSRYHLDEVGKSMLLQKIMASHKETLGIYTRYIKKPGFIQKMDALFSEFKHYQLDTAQLRKTLVDGTLRPQTKQKMSTLIDLYDAFTETILTQYVTTEDYFTLLHELISQSELINGAEIYIDGYHTFNPQEQLIIQQLARHAKKITMTLTLDLANTTSLYETTRTTYASLTEKLIEIGLKPSVSQLDGHNNPVGVCRASEHVKTSFLQSGVPYSGLDGISFFSAGSKRAEIEEVAKRIHQLVQDGGVHYHNIAIYSANPAEDYRLYEALLPVHGVPYFLDYKEMMLSHPVINLLHKVFDIFTSNWNNQAIFNVLKTGLFVDVDRFAKGASYEDAVHRHLEEIDLLENYVLARNIKKHNWLSGEAWIYSRFEGAKQTDDDLKKQALINSVKQEVVLPLMMFEARLEQAKTTQEYAMEVFKFLENLAIPQKKLQLLAESAGVRGNMKEKKQHEQVWAKLLSLLEQVVEVGGSDELLLTDFIQIIKVGLEQMTYATIPAALDGVQIGSVKRSRYQLSTNFTKPAAYGIKHAFIIGLNDGVLPSTPAESSLLTERDREALSRLDVQLAPSLIKSQQDEIFSLYTILATAKASITLSYLTENEAIPSHIFTHLRSLFPDVEVCAVTVDDVYDRLTTAQALFSKTLLSFKQNPENRGYYAPILQYYKQVDPLKVALMERAVGYENAVCKLEESITKELYGEEIEASVSRVERFNHCEFAHFISYGLHLRERDLGRITMPDIGSLYHEVLKYISMMIKKEGRSFASLTDEACKQLVDLGIHAVQRRFAFSILESSERMRVLKSKLAGVVYQTLLTLSRQGKRSAFKEHSFELPFGRRPTDVIKTKQRQVGSFKFSLRGIIDRIDVARSGDRAYLRVVDYKSGKKELELDAVYYGLSLQLLTYLDVAINGASQISDIGGALYFHVHRPYTSYHAEILTADHLKDELLTLQASEQKMTGYLPKNHDVARLSDTDLDVRVTASDIVPVTLKKDGNFAARGNRMLATEDFDMLREFANHKIEASVTKMISGHLAINPMKHKGKSACDFCQYQSICKFEFAYHTQRVLPQMKPDVALDKMKEIASDFKK
jgi:ATP-dependent helicase/nuclease subunit B